MELLKMFDKDETSPDHAQLMYDQLVEQINNCDLLEIRQKYFALHPHYEISANGTLVAQADGKYLKLISETLKIRTPDNIVVCNGKSEFALLQPQDWYFTSPNGNIILQLDGKFSIVSRDRYEIIGQNGIRVGFILEKMFKIMNEVHLLSNSKQILYSVKANFNIGDSVYTIRRKATNCGEFTMFLALCTAMCHMNVKRDDRKNDLNPLSN